MTLRLTPFTAEHFDILPRWFADQKALAGWGGSDLRHPLNHRQMVSMLKGPMGLPGSQGDKPLALAFMAMEDQVVVGHGQLRFDWLNGTARLCRIAVAPACRGKRFSTPLVRLLTAEAFANDSIMRAELNVYSWNTVAIRSYQQAGFVHEGVRRSSTRVGTEYWDTAMMSMLRCEWLTE